MYSIQLPSVVVATEHLYDKKQLLLCNYTWIHEMRIRIFFITLAQRNLATA